MARKKIETDVVSDDSTSVEENATPEVAAAPKRRGRPQILGPKILDLLRFVETPITVETIREQLEIGGHKTSKVYLNMVLKKMAQDKKLDQYNRGVRGEPFCYLLAGTTPVFPDPPVEESAPTTEEVSAD